MNGFMDWLSGKKTYVVGAIAAAVGIAAACGVAIAPAIYPVLGALGLATMRAGVKKAEARADRAAAQVAHAAGQFGPLGRAVGEAQKVANQLDVMVAQTVKDAKQTAQQIERSVSDGVRQAKDVAEQVNATVSDTVEQARAVAAQIGEALGKLNVRT